MNKLLFLVVSCILLLSTTGFSQEAIRHKMLLLDESRHCILYVDESDASKNWTYQLPDKDVWDAQFIGDNKVIFAATNAGGFWEFDWTTRKITREVLDKKYAPTRSAIRLPDGQTVLGVDQKNTQIYILDKDGKEVRFLDMKDTQSIRLIRRTSRNTLIFGGKKEVFEITLAGEQIRKMDVPNAGYNYQTMELPNGNWLTANGYGCQLVEFNPVDGKVVRTFGGNPPPEGVFYLFTSKFQILKNEHIVVATWTGHNAKDSDKGQQIVEFDKDGKIVWTWHHPELAGSLNGVIVLDDIDTTKFSEE